MVEIITLLLGLIAGPHAVEIVAAPEVASVVVQLDGEVVAGVVPEDGAGKVEVSFGTLLPHRLTAVAYDAAGREIGRDDEWVNLPRPAIAARLALHGEPRAPASATLHWEHLAREPTTVREVAASVDGRPLEVDGEHRIALPDVDPGTPHLLVVLVTFSNGERIELARSFGGGAVDEVATRLLPVWMEPREGAAWPEETSEIASCFAAPEGVRVHGWEEGPAEVFVVRDQSAEESVARLVRDGLARSRRRAGASPDIHRLLSLRRGDALRQVWPIPDRVRQDGRELTLFPSTERESSDERGMVAVLRERLEPPRGEQDLGGAVAVAGLLAYGSRRPGGVVLLVGAPEEETGRRSPAAVRAFLAALGVPFQVWSVAGPGVALEWGPAVDASTYSRLAQAVADLRAGLDRQRLVWLAGVDLPQDVRFADCGCCRPVAAR